MKDYADKLIIESRNNVNYQREFTQKMYCPNRWPLGKLSDWADPDKYWHKKNMKISVCPSGEDNMVDMHVRHDGIWTTIIRPLCGYKDWSSDPSEFG